MVRMRDRLAAMPPDRRLNTLGELPAHLSDAQQFERLSQLLDDFEFIEAKIAEFGPQPAIEDYDLLHNFPEDGPAKSVVLRQVQSSLRMSADVIGRDPGQLAAQLLGRLREGQHPEIDSLRRQARSGADSPRLLPLSPSLIPPDSPLLRNLGDGTFSLFAVAVTPDGRRAIYGGEDEDAVVLDLEAGQEIMRLSGHQSWINAVAISSDGKLVVTGSDDNTAKVWNLETKEEVSTFRGHTGAVWSVAFTPDELWVVSGSNDQTIRVWDLKNGCEKAVLRGHDGPVWSLAVSPKQDVLVSGSKDGTLRVWDLGSGQHLSTLAHKSSPVNSVAISPDGKKVLSGSLDGTVAVWNLQRGRRSEN